MHVFHAYRYLFIGSSILLIYDNDNAAPHSRWARALERATRLHPDTYATLRRKTRVDVRMIDFAHVGSLPRGQQRDEGYITGLKTVISALAHTMCGPARCVWCMQMVHGHRRRGMWHHRPHRMHHTW